MSEPLDEQYFVWLYSQVASVKARNPARTYWSLTKQLYTKEFVWLVPNDDNRVEDGRDLRHEFVDSSHILPDPEWMNMGCSVLEMLIGLSRRLAFESEGESSDWFWRLIENLGLQDFSDAHYGVNIFRIVDSTIERVIWRTYDFSGFGGLFPLDDPTDDQRTIEIWYQMSNYLLERT